MCFGPSPPFWLSGSFLCALFSVLHCMEVFPTKWGLCSDTYVKNVEQFVPGRKHSENVNFQLLLWLSLLSLSSAIAAEFSALQCLWIWLLGSNWGSILSLPFQFSLSLWTHAGAHAWEGSPHLLPSWVQQGWPSASSLFSLSLSPHRGSYLLRKTFASPPPWHHSFRSLHSPIYCQHFCFPLRLTSWWERGWLFWLLEQ